MFACGHARSRANDDDTCHSLVRYSPKLQRHGACTHSVGRASFRESIEVGDDFGGAKRDDSLVDPDAQ